ncbi:hypothetical protein [Marivita sp. XM-24bin2]|jgi:hypothetical protein|uniref:hypothetical protein n=1 Tax=unclassified Marivita TaxID=2632480 RepID=UPI000D790397|nr:hypothetical protein [Marivita sp. XM-24bin2]MCR9107846.1 hypothetical protein [Paracoccaceae bacterium]PWL33675.1 MAG: hypothetical protein DCO97_18305 [Marivita sp. XM-24bin2]
MWRAALIPGFLLAACTEFPEVDAVLATGERQAEYPALLPFEDLVAQQDSELTEVDDDVLIRRAENLRNRANGLREPVIDPDTRDRMDDGVTQP